MVEIKQDKRESLYNKYQSLIEIDPNLDRTLVSFQANKKESFYRWFKYKEGFSKRLVKYFLSKYHPEPGHILDPFAGVGSTLFAARELGWESTGIELLPVGVYALKARLASETVDPYEFSNEIKKFNNNFKLNIKLNGKIKHISITQGAFPKETEEYLNSYLEYCDSILDENIKLLFKFGAFSILEEISYTRKDGQYLRWDSRANKSWSKSKFNKGKIFSFDDSIERKLKQIHQDLNHGNGYDLFSQISETKPNVKKPRTKSGSSLEIMPQFEEEAFDFITTSPPYCNRYDYTRTYALELVFLGYNDDEVKNLRQEMLSCTVENKEKIERLRTIYMKNARLEDFEKVLSVYQLNGAMQEVNYALNILNERKLLNNSNIPRMVKNYLLEMAFIIFEMSRVLRKSGCVVMVNDNVRYGGQEIPVDLILSEFAENFGFKVEKIWILPVGKGNSSQQMGIHGRTELRKCVYVWRKHN